MAAPPHLNERSIFSYSPPAHNPSAKEIALQNRNNNNSNNNIDDVNEKFANIIDCPTEIHCTLPDGIKIENRPTSDGETNWGVYATKFFPKHSIVFISPSTGYVYEKDVDYKLIIDPEGPSLTLNTLRHMCPCAKGVRQAITYSAMINHSCDPSCYWNTTYQDLDEDQEAAVIALRDIHPNDEITGDYSLAVYDVSGFDGPCHCQMPSCRGSCPAFQSLSVTEQEKLLPYTELNVQVAYWMNKHDLQ